jgi:hypothetical protein
MRVVEILEDGTEEDVALFMQEEDAGGIPHHTNAMSPMVCEGDAAEGSRTLVPTKLLHRKPDWTLPELMLWVDGRLTQALTTPIFISLPSNATAVTMQGKAPGHGWRMAYRDATMGDVQLDEQRGVVLGASPVATKRLWSEISNETCEATRAQVDADASCITDSFQGWHLEQPPKRRTLSPRVGTALGSSPSLRSGLCPGSGSMSQASTSEVGGGAAGAASVHEARTPVLPGLPASPASSTSSRAPVADPSPRKRKLFEELPSMLRSMESDLNAMNIVELGTPKRRDAKLPKLPTAVESHSATTH